MTSTKGWPAGKPEPVTVPPDAEPELVDDQPVDPELN